MMSTVSVPALHAVSVKDRSMKHRNTQSRSCVMRPRLAARWTIKRIKYLFYEYTIRNTSDDLTVAYYVQLEYGHASSIKAMHSRLSRCISS